MRPQYALWKIKNYRTYIFSQEIHNKHGGVVPELASRSHLRNLQEITYNLFEEIKKIIKKLIFFVQHVVQD